MHRLSPYAAECPVCGLELAQRSLPRPLLFQASALQKPIAPSRKSQHAIATPALGRVEPLSVSTEAPPLHGGSPEEPKPNLIPGLPIGIPLNSPPNLGDLSISSFWPLVRMEVTEFAALLAINILFMALASLLAGIWPTRLYPQLWLQFLLIHLSLSWAYVMLPLALTGQSLAMARLGLLLDAHQSDRRLTFSMFHLLSVLCWPLSFLCLVLTPNHRTLAELLTGQEILQRPLPKMR